MMIIIMSSLTSPELNTTSTDKKTQRELAIRRAQFIKKLKIHIKSSDQKIDEDRLIIIETFNTQKNKPVELVMRRLSQLDSFVTHINTQYGGHVIPVFNYDLYYQDSIKMAELVPDIQDYLNDLKHNKYCRQDIKFYCFMIEQHASFPRQLGIGKIISNATDKSRRYLNDVFTRKTLPSLKDTDMLVYSYQQLKIKIQQYGYIKQLSIIKSRETLVFEEVSEILAELSAWPGVAIQPQQLDIEFICKSIKSSEKLIQQSKQAYIRWQKLADGVLELQNNVYKGLHQYEHQFNQKNEQLREWSESLSRQFNDLNQYLTDKMEALSGEVYKINKRFIDMTVFAGQSMKLDDQSNKSMAENQKNRLPKNLRQPESSKQEKQQVVLEQSNPNNEKICQKIKLKSSGSFEINEQIQIGPIERIQFNQKVQPETSDMTEQHKSPNPSLEPKQQITCDDN